MKKRFIIALGLLIGMCTAHAQSFASDMDFGTNISTPVVDRRAHDQVSAHMQAIQKALTNAGFVANKSRNDEVIELVIPCSELYAPNDTVIKDKGRQRLQILKDFLKYPTMYKLLIAVYADDTGDQVYSDNITAARANSIDDVLIEIAGNHNINVIPYGMGSLDPVAPNNSIENRSKNRRVVISIVPEQQMIKDAKAGKLI